MSPDPWRDSPGRGGHRYGHYVTGPDPLAPPVDLSEALNRIGAEVMAGYSPEGALRELLRQGLDGRQGLDDLAARLARRRQELLRENSLDGTLSQVRTLLDEAVLAERKQLARDLDDDARFAETVLESLPRSTAKAVAELQQYPWRSSEARERFEQISDLLGRELLDQRFAGMKQALEGATDEDRQRVQEMVQALNELLDEHRAGRAGQQDFDQFMAQYGDFFPENPQTIEELLDLLAARSAAAQRMLNSMTPEQRAELAELSRQAFGGPQLDAALQGLGSRLQDLRPDAGWDGSENFSGEQGVGLGEGTGMLAELGDLEELGEQLGQAYPGAGLDDVDLDALVRALGDEAGADLQTLRALEQALSRDGLLRRGTDGSLRLSPKAIRLLGRDLLRDVAERLSGRSGSRDTRRSGAAGELTGQTRAWAFGDTEPWAVPRSLTNAVLRSVGEGGDPTAGIRLGLDDLEVQETEDRTRAVVALLVDTSFSMAMDGRWVPMKRTALALHSLVSTRFRGDELELIAFGPLARRLEIDELTALDVSWDKGTNLQHALLLARRLFRRHPDAQPVLLVVTDGEPTSHLENGRPVFWYPPDPHTIALTVQALDEVARLGAQVSFFRLGDDPGLTRFVDSMARRVDGRVVAPELSDLGAAVVGSYLGDRRG